MLNFKIQDIFLDSHPLHFCLLSFSLLSKPNLSLKVIFFPQKILLYKANYKHPLPQDSNNSISSCPPHWIQFGHKCFSPIHDTPLPWSAAEKHCSNFVDGKAHLPSVHSPSELTFISKLYTEVNVWLGLQIHRKFLLILK